MNILHLKYAVEVEKTSSLNKAAENLFVSQPNLSRAVKELEESLGITIFKRTSKGMFPTEQGEEFLHRAKGILAHIAEVEAEYSRDPIHNQTFSVSAPRVSYIGNAFTAFAASLDRSKNIDLRYEEANAARTVDNILQNGFHLGIIRFRSDYYPYFESLFYEKGLRHKPICEFSHNILISKDNPLSEKEVLTEQDLEPLIKLSHGDPFIPGAAAQDMRKFEAERRSARSICIYDRAIQFDLLSSIPDCYLPVCTVPEPILKSYRLKIVRSASLVLYTDMLIYKKEYSLSRADNAFLDYVMKSAEEAGLRKH